MDKKVKILDTLQIQQKLDRLAYEVYENNFEEKELLVVGIEGNGYKIAAHLCKRLKTISPIKITLGKIALDKNKPWEGEPVIDFTEKAFVNKTVILVDDVLNSGTTLVYGVKHFLEVPIKKFKTVVLIDRNHKKYPVKADFKGLSLSTSSKEHVNVVFETDKSYAFLV